jgi:hypothetical protein
MPIQEPEPLHDVAGLLLAVYAFCLVLAVVYGVGAWLG